MSGKLRWENKSIKLLLVGFLFFLIGCHINDKSFGKSKWTTQKLEDGDIIYRHGNGFFSDYFRKSSNKEQLYSHVGIIIIDDNRIYVIHSEASELTGVGGVRKELLSTFLKGISTWAVYRLDTTQIIRDSISYIATQYLNKKTAFDLDFDNTSDGRVYCTELIALSVNKAAHTDLIKATGRIGDKHYFAIDDTYLIKEMKPIIKRIDTKL